MSCYLYEEMTEQQAKQLGFELHRTAKGELRWYSYRSINIHNSGVLSGEVDPKESYVKSYISKLMSIDRGQNAFGQLFKFYTGEEGQNNNIWKDARDAYDYYEGNRVGNRIFCIGCSKKDFTLCLLWSLYKVLMNWYESGRMASYDLFEYRDIGYLRKNFSFANRETSKELIQEEFIAEAHSILGVVWDVGDTNRARLSFLLGNIASLMEDGSEIVVWYTGDLNRFKSEQPDIYENMVNESVPVDKVKSESNVSLADGVYDVSL